MSLPPSLPDMAQVARPALEITLESCDNKTIKMVYGLEMDLRRMLPDPQSAMQLLMNDAYTQDYVVRRCLTDSRKMALQPDELISPDDMTIDSEDVETLLAWVAEHVMYFFMKRASGMAQLASRFKMGQQNPSTAGSENSPS